MENASTIDIHLTRQRLRQFVVQNFLFGDEKPFGDNDSLLQNNIIDSTGILELVHHLEQTYGITVEDHELLPENLDSVDNVVSFLVRKVSI